jgi:hypothetical protein
MKTETHPYMTLHLRKEIHVEINDLRVSSALG